MQSPLTSQPLIAKKNLLRNLASFLIIGAIIFFLARALWRDWSSLNFSDIEIDYFSLLVGTLLSMTAIASFSLIWRRIMKFLHPLKEISILSASRIYLYSQFGKYIPGKAWGYLGLIYLGQNQGFEKNALLASVIYEIVLSVASIFFLPLIIFSFYPGIVGLNYGFLPFLPIAGVLVFIHPQVLHYCFRMASRLLNVSEISKTYFLSFRQIGEIFLYNLLLITINGFGFFFFLRAFVDVSFSDILIFSSFFIFSGALGLVAIFAPAGLGVREGFLTYFLKLYLPQSLSIFISLSARVWTTLMEIVLLAIILLLDWLAKKKSTDI